MTQPYSMDIRNAPISEEGPDNETAMANVANTLRAVSSSPKPKNTISNSIKASRTCPSPEAPRSPRRAKHSLRSDIADRLYSERLRLATIRRWPGIPDIRITTY